jgi:peptidoglycan/LPS O-acetylase OafA/YrhL
MQQKRTIYFPNLDGLRFVSFILVFLSHSVGAYSEKHTVKEGLLDQVPIFLFNNGKMGVSVFFVLSGFLITYLLLAEKQVFGKIDLKAFYMRRILRIWPLYFLVLIFGFIFFPYLQSLTGGSLHDDSSPIYYFTFLSNFDVIRIQEHQEYQNLFLTVTWSISIEEQFYILWPLIFFFVKPKAYQTAFYLILAISGILILFFIDNDFIENFGTHSAIFDLCVGGLAAYYSIRSDKFTGFFRDLPLRYLLIIYCGGFFILIFRHLLFDFAYGFFVKKILSVLFFTFIILDQNYHKRKRWKLIGSPFISKWGKYTYGLYLLHPIALLIMGKLFVIGHFSKESLYMTTIYAASGLIISFILAYISYHYFEKYFLKQKARLSHFTKDPGS